MQKPSEVGAEGTKPWKSSVDPWNEAVANPSRVRTHSLPKDPTASHPHVWGDQQRIQQLHQQKDTPGSKELASFLQELGLLRYLSLFIAADIDLEKLRCLSLEDLTKLGVKLGPRRKIWAKLQSDYINDLLTNPEHFDDGESGAGAWEEETWGEYKEEDGWVQGIDPALKEDLDLVNGEIGTWETDTQQQQIEIDQPRKDEGDNIDNMDRPVVIPNTIITTEKTTATNTTKDPSLPQSRPRRPNRPLALVVRRKPSDTVSVSPVHPAEAMDPDGSLLLPIPENASLSPQQRPRGQTMSMLGSKDDSDTNATSLSKDTSTSTSRRRLSDDPESNGAGGGPASLVRRQSKEMAREDKKKMLEGLTSMPDASLALKQKAQLQRSTPAALSVTTTPPLTITIPTVTPPTTPTGPPPTTPTATFLSLSNPIPPRTPGSSPVVPPANNFHSPSPIVNLDFIVDHQILCPLLRKFMEARLCVENLNFFNSVSAFQKRYPITPSVGLERGHFITDINNLYAKHFTRVNEEEVNVDIEVKQTVETRMQDPDCHIFDEAKRAIRSLISVNILPTFQRTPEFKAIMDLEDVKSKLVEEQHTLRDLQMKLEACQQQISDLKRKESVLEESVAVIVEQKLGGKKKAGLFRKPHFFSS